MYEGGDGINRKTFFLLLYLLMNPANCKTFHLETFFVYAVVLFCFWVLSDLCTLYYVN